MTAVVISQNDEDSIERAVRAVVDQECAEPFEVVVVTSGTDRTAHIVRDRFPMVRLVELPHPVLPGAARNAGLALARGRYVTFPGSHVELPPGSLAARLEAHKRGYAMVSGTMHPGTRTRAGWASFFLDHNSKLSGRPSAPLTEAPATCSYLRAALDHIGGFPEDMRAGEDTWMNNELFDLGYGAWRERDAHVVHHTRCRTARQLVQHHFSRGRSYGQLITMRRRTDQRLFTRRLLRSTLVLYVPGRVLRVRRRILEWGNDEQRREWRRSLPLVVAAVIASWLGTWRELLRRDTL